MKAPQKRLFAQGDFFFRIGVNELAGRDGDGEVFSVAPRSLPLLWEMIEVSSVQRQRICEGHIGATGPEDCAEQNEWEELEILHEIQMSAAAAMPTMRQ